jgi:hypothetical protein
MVLLFSFVLIFLFSSPIDSMKPTPIAHIPFTLNRNRVIFPVSVNNSKQLNITLDTGMTFNGVYLFHKELSDKLLIKNLIEVRVGGAGSGEASYAIMADSLTLTSGGMNFNNQKVVISQSEITQEFSSDGVAGDMLLGSYVVEIDYDSCIIKLYNPETFTPDTTWEKIQLTLKEKIPFLNAIINTDGKKETFVILYIDFSMAEGLELLIMPDMKITLPDSLTENKYLGSGLSGDIYGKIGKIASLKIGPFELKNVPTAFPSAEVRSKQKGADGILGGDVLKRFNIIFDYSRGQMYWRQSSQYSAAFE